MHRSPRLVLAGVLLTGCPGGDDGATSTTTDTTGTTSGTTAVVTGSTTTVPTSGTTDATTSGTTDATPSGTTGTTDATSTTGSPVTTTDPTRGGDSQTTNGGPAPTVECGELPPGVVGVAYAATLTASGGMGTPYEWAFSQFPAPPPAWLTLTPSAETDTAELGGVPAEAGSFTFHVVVTSAGVEDPGEASCELQIAAAAAPDVAPR